MYRIQKVQLGEFFAFCAKEVPKKDKVANGPIDNNLDISSEFKVIPLGESSAFCAKEVPKKDKVANGTISNFKNDISELKMSQNGTSPQKNFDRKKVIIFICLHTARLYYIYVDK